MSAFLKPSQLCTKIELALAVLLIPLSAWELELKII